MFNIDMNDRERRRALELVGKHIDAAKSLQTKLEMNAPGVELVLSQIKFDISGQAIHDHLAPILIDSIDERLKKPKSDSEWRGDAPIISESPDFDEGKGAMI